MLELVRAKNGRKKNQGKIQDGLNMLNLLFLMKPYNPKIFILGMCKIAHSLILDNNI